MRKLLWPVSMLFVLLTGNALAQPANNIAVTEILLPNGRVPLGIPMGIAAEFRNTGTNDQTDVLVKATIKNSSGTVVYTDSKTLNNWVSDEYRDTSFRDYTPTQKSSYTICFTAELEGDEVASDDELCRSLDSRYETDAFAEAIIFPVDTAIKPGSELRVRARFGNTSVSDLYNLRTRVQIKRCSDGVLVFQADSIPGIPELNVDTKVEFEFPGKAGNFDTRKLLPGCYRVAAIVLYSADVDRTNDTAFSEFTILPFANDIKADSFIVPTFLPKRMPNTVMTPEVRFTNNGNKAQASVQVQVVVRDSGGQIVLSDIVTVSNWPAKESRAVKFKSLTLSKLGKYTIQAFANLPNDETRLNDSLFTSFNVDGLRNAWAHSAVVPLENDKWEVGGFQPAARFAADLCSIGTYTNVRVYAYVYRDLYYDPVASLDTTIPVLNADGKDVLVVFPSTNKNLKQLPAGKYRMEFSIGLTNDERLEDNRKTVAFKITDRRIVSSVLAETVFEPADGSSAYPAANPVPIKVRFMNNGINDLMHVPTFAEIRYYGNVVYRDTVIVSSMESTDWADVTFNNFDLGPQPLLGWYTLTTWCRYPADLVQTDDTIRSSFARGYPIDAHVKAITHPAPLDTIPQQRWTPLSAIMAWHGTNAVGSNIRTLFEIRSCKDSQLVLSSERILSSLFPMEEEIAIWEDWFVNSPPGCYFAKLRASYDPTNNTWNDENYGDNEAVSVFEIVESSDVRRSSQTFSLTNYPNPAGSYTTLSFTLPASGTVSLRVIGVTGEPISVIDNEYFAAGTHTRSVDLRTFPAAIYLCELTVTANSKADRLTKTMVIVR